MTLPANVDLVSTDKYRATAAPNASSRQQNRASLRLCDLAKIYLNSVIESSPHPLFSHINRIPNILKVGA